MLPAHPRTSVSRTRSYNEEEHGKPLRAILGVDRRCYRRPTACSPVWPLILLSSLFLPFFYRLLRLCLPPSPVILTSLPFTLARVHPLFLRVPFTFLLLPSVRHHFSLPFPSLPRYPVVGVPSLSLPPRPIVSFSSTLARPFAPFLRLPPRYIR